MADLLRVSLLGSLPGGEKWSINPVFAFTTGIAVSTDDAAAVATAINSVPVPGTLTAINPASVAITGTRVEARSFAGVLESVAEVARTTPSVGTSANAHPYQTSIVCSLRTSNSTARGKGRLYYPAIGINLSSTTLRIPAVDVGNFLTGMKTYLSGMQTAVRSVGGFTTAGLSVWSRSNSARSLVLSIRAGDIADVQRRRRDSVVESYQAAAFP